MNIVTMFILFVIAMVVVLMGEFFYLKNSVSRFLKFWKLDRNPKTTKRLKIAIMSLLMVMTVLVFTMAGLWILHCLIMCAATDLICYIIRKITKNDSTVLKFISCSWIIPILLGSSIMLYGYININNVVQTDYTIYTSKELSRDYRIAFMADIHMGISVDDHELQDICDKISSQNPDMLVLVGDVVDESTSREDMIKAFEILGNVKTKFGVFFVYGNHDDVDSSPHNMGSEFNTKEVEEALETAKITVLTDETLSVGEDIVLIGHKDASFTDKDNSGVRVPIEELSQNLDLDKFILLLDHQPTMFEENKKAGVDLQLSGHTHAGQIWPLGYFVTLFGTGEADYGYVAMDEFKAVITSGVSGWSFPFRTEENSEYVMLTLTEQ